MYFGKEFDLMTTSTGVWLSGNLSLTLIHRRTGSASMVGQASRKYRKVSMAAFSALPSGALSLAAFNLTRAASASIGLMISASFSGS